MRDFLGHFISYGSLGLATVVLIYQFLLGTRLIKGYTSTFSELSKKNKVKYKLCFQISAITFILLATLVFVFDYNFIISRLFTSSAQKLLILVPMKIVQWAPVFLTALYGLTFLFYRGKNRNPNFFMFRFLGVTVGIYLAIFGFIF